MKFTTTHTFEWPAEKIIGLLKAGEDLFPMENLPNVNARKPLEQKRQGSKIFRKYEWCVHGQIPKIAQKMLRPEMLTFIEESVWDDDRCTFDSRILPHYFKNAITCESTSAWRESGAGVERRIDSTVRVAIPIVGPVVEKAVVEAFRKNNDMSAGLIRKGLAEKLG